MATHGRARQRKDMKGDHMGDTAKTVPECSIDTLTMQNRLEQMAIGESVAYEELSALIGRDVRLVPHLVVSARRRAEKSGHLVLAAIPGIGIRRLEDSAIVGQSDGARRRLRNAARRGYRRLTNVKDFAALSPELQRRHNLNASYFGVVDALMQPAKMKALEAKMGTAQQPLQLTQCFEAIKDSL